MKHKILIATVTTALLTFTTAPAIFAAEVVKTEATVADAAADAVFMTTVTRANLMEIKAAEIAHGKTERDSVKDFTKSIEKDFKDVNKNLTALADRMKMEMPKDVGDHQAFLDGLKTKTDSDFDRTYVAATAINLQKCVTQFEGFSRTTKNADLKAFADNTLPGLRTHLKNSQALLETLGGTKGARTP